MLVFYVKLTKGKICSISITLFQHFYKDENAEVLILSCIKWLNILLKSCGVHTARFLKYVWPFYNIMYERVKVMKLWSYVVSFLTNGNKGQCIARGFSILTKIIATDDKLAVCWLLISCCSLKKTIISRNTEREKLRIYELGITCDLLCD